MTRYALLAMFYALFLSFRTLALEAPRTSIYIWGSEFPFVYESAALYCCMVVFIPLMVKISIGVGNRLEKFKFSVDRNAFLSGIITNILLLPATFFLLPSYNFSTNGCETPVVMLINMLLLFGTLGLCIFFIWPIFSKKNTQSGEDNSLLALV